MYDIAHLPGLIDFVSYSFEYRKITQCKNQLQENLFIVNAVSIMISLILYLRYNDAAQ